MKHWRRVEHDDLGPYRCPLSGELLHCATCTQPLRDLTMSQHVATVFVRTAQAYRPSGPTPGALRIDTLPGVEEITLAWEPLAEGLLGDEKGPAWGAYLSPAQALGVARALLEALEQVKAP